jgi:hypothetical protein
VAKSQNHTGGTNQKGKAPLYDRGECAQKKPPRNSKSCWRAPPNDWIKLNTDASFIGENLPGGAGGVARNSGQDADDAEAWSAHLGIRLLEGLGHDKIILESDCASAVNAIRSDEPDRSKLWHTHLTKQKSC